MTPEQIAEDKRICEAATKSPWMAVGVFGHHEVMADNGTPICGVYFNGDGRCVDGCPSRQESYANHIFIARARTALPDYIATLEQAQARIAELEHLISEAPNIVKELARMEALIAKLPKTSDGVPIVPGMKLFSCSHNDNGDIWEWVTPDSDVTSESGVTKIWDESNEEFNEEFNHELYSTREAALAQLDGGMPTDPKRKIGETGGKA